MCGYWIRGLISLEREGQMNEELRKKCDELIRNYQIMRLRDRSDYQSMTMAGAAIFLEAGVTPDLEMLDHCKTVLKGRKGIFSNYRGISQYIIRCKMALSGSPERYLTDLDRVYAELRPSMPGEQVLLAAMIIVDFATPVEYVEAIRRTKTIYSEMKYAHPFLTSQEDMPFAALMAVLGVNERDTYGKAETIYELLKKGLKAGNDSRQMLSHILSFSDGKEEDKAEKVRQLAEGLRNAGHGLSRDRYISVLGMLAASGISSALLVDMICEADDYLQQFKPFRGAFGTGRQIRRMFAVQMVEAALGENYYTMMTGPTNVSTMVSTAIDVAVITMIIACSAAAA